MVREPPFAIAHDVWVTPAALLARLMRERLDQGDPAREQPPSSGAQDTRRGLVVSATAPDGVVEALEDPSRRFCLGVQWHPENFWTASSGIRVHRRCSKRS